MCKFTRLRRARMERGLRQVELSRRAKIRQPLLSDFENGRLIPGEEMQERLAKILKVPADWLFGREA